jgi:CheY-like chemotaxis protein
MLGSSIHISKTIMNLITNAAESITGEGTVQIKTANLYIDKPISGYENVVEGDYVLLSIIDTGQGITPEDLKRIFEPFYTKKVMGISGTGLGMSVVWSTVKDHKGYIDVKSGVGEGTECLLYFPVTRKEPKATREDVLLEEYKGNEKIFIVDDVQDQREVAHRFLTKLGYRVKTFSSGEKAIEYMRAHSADLVILDMIMDPGMDGLDTYKGILEIHPGQKAIIASGFSETDRVREAQELGAGIYIRKPYVLYEMGKAVREELDKKSSGNEQTEI